VTLHPVDEGKLEQKPTQGALCDIVAGPDISYHYICWLLLDNRLLG